MTSDAGSGPGDDVPPPIGETIRRLREAAKLSTRALAAKAAISQPFLSQIERGIHDPSLATTYRLARALGVAPGDLLPAMNRADVSLVRVGEGSTIPVADRPDAAAGRALLMERGLDLQVVEYLIRPGEYLEEWFESVGASGLYVVSGRLRVELENTGVYDLGPRDFLSYPGGIKDRWTLLGAEPALVLFTSTARPDETPRRDGNGRTAG